MEKWVKGIILFIIGNFLNDAIPMWLAEYLLSLPNPFYSIGSLIKLLPSAQDFTSSTNVKYILGFAGIAFILYAFYLFFKRIYKESNT